MTRRGTFHSAKELEKAIGQWRAAWNGAPAPFVWKASADVMLDKVRRCEELRERRDQDIADSCATAFARCPPFRAVPTLERREGEQQKKN